MTTASIRSEKRRMAKNGDGRDRDPDLPGQAPDVFDRHVFEGQSADEKLDRLLSLYSGVASHIHSSQRATANLEIEVRQKLGKLDYIEKCQRLIMAALNIQPPTEPPPPPAARPSRRRTDG
jgi:hypothetical protein